MAEKTPTRKVHRIAISFYGSISDIACSVDYGVWDRTSRRKLRGSFTTKQAGERNTTGKHTGKKAAKRQADDARLDDLAPAAAASALAAWLLPYRPTSPTAEQLPAATAPPTPAAAPSTVVQLPRPAQPASNLPQQAIPRLVVPRSKAFPPQLGPCVEYSKRVAEHGCLAGLYKKMVEVNRNQTISLAERLAHQEYLRVNFDFGVPGKQRPPPPPGQVAYSVPYVDIYRKYQKLVDEDGLRDMDTSDDVREILSTPKRRLDDPLTLANQGDLTQRSFMRYYYDDTVNNLRDITHMLERQGTTAALAEATMFRILLIRYDAAAFLPSMVMAEEERALVQLSIERANEKYAAELARVRAEQ